MRIVNLPPQMSGRTEDQIALLRNYLIELSNAINDILRTLEEIKKEDNKNGKQ